mmetsp:Transcript_37749/g.57012  ORF Transcript_37749/g.57012 Transcript_37749/m.57012 type:complete len:83 (-) Transcript_37749:13-261(-)
MHLSMSHRRCASCGVAKKTQKNPNQALHLSRIGQKLPAHVRSLSPAEISAASSILQEIRPCMSGFQFWKIVGGIANVEAELV